MSALFALVLGSGVAHAEEPAAPATEAAIRDDAAWKYFGEAFTVTTPLEAGEVLADPSKFADGSVRMRGELTDVCQKMGCWAVVRDDAGHSIRITMKDHGFGIDKDTAGKACDIEGTLVKKDVDPEKVEHMKSEGSKNNPEEGKTETWELVATSVAVAR